MDTIYPSSKLPLGILFLSKLRKKDFRSHECRILVLVVTFAAYTCFHASRKPLSIVKSVLDPEVLKYYTSYAEPPNILSPSSLPPIPSQSLGWEPFNGDLGKARLGEMDVAFLASYAAGMYYAGALGDRLDLRKFLTFGMVSSGLCVCLFGFGYFWDIHSFWYYFIIQVITGLLSSIGWPVVVAIVATWFGKTKKGLIMGIWNAHAPVGNIAGSMVAAAALPFGWGWSFLLPGLSIIMCALLVYCFLIVDPASLGSLSTTEDNDRMTSSADEEKVLLANIELGFRISNNNTGHDSPHHVVSDMPLSPGLKLTGKGAVGIFDELDIVESESIVLPSSASGNDAVKFMEAWNIPGVALYAFCLFFVKLVAYTFLYWLPFYIRHTEIGGEYLSDKTAGYLSTVFDIGGVIGGIIAGHLSDKYSVKALIAVVFIYCAVPSLYGFRTYGGRSLPYAVGLMFVSGILVNGPYALITTAVSADLGSDSSLKGNARALATVSAIIDGTGSVGAAIGPFLTGYIATTSWTSVFIMLAISLLIAGLFLTKLVLAEIKEKIRVYQGLTRVDISRELTEIVG